MLKKTSGTIILWVSLIAKHTFALSSTLREIQPSSKVSYGPDNVEEGIKRFHAVEVANGREAFSAKSIEHKTSITWEDDDFISRYIGENNAGLDATYLPKNGNQIFESTSPIVTKEECQFIVEEARNTILEGLKREAALDEPEGRRVNEISNSELGEARLSNMPKTREWLQETLQTRFYPLLKNRFGVEDITLYDGLVLGNIAPTRSQPIHRDASLLTLNVALSSIEDYDGGGTYIEALDEILKIDQGHLLCHAGSAMHAGNAISSGERWVFVLFLLGENQPQISRRCHAQAIEYIREGDLDNAEEVLNAGLQSIAPHHDHLLHNTMGRLQLMKGNHPSRAIESFQKADQAYPICQEAMASIAQLFMERRRPRAALRRFDILLDRINDRDLNPGGPAQISLKSLAYGARRDAARCALMCADHLYRSQTKGDTLSSSRASWIQVNLPTAINRMKTCLVAAPNEPTLLGMLDHAEFLLNKAKQL